MKQIILLILIPIFCLAGSLTQTTEEVQAAINGELGNASFGDTSITFEASTSPATLIPIEGPWTDSFAGSADFTISAANGTITCNFDGRVRLNVNGSFSSSASAVFTGNFYLDTTNTSYGFVRNIANPNQFGSFAGSHPVLSVSNGEVITFKVSVDSGTPTATFHDLAVSAKRIE